MCAAKAYNTTTPILITAHGENWGLKWTAENVPRLRSEDLRADWTFFAPWLTYRITTRNWQTLPVPNFPTWNSLNQVLIYVPAQVDLAHPSLLEPWREYSKPNQAPSAVRGYDAFVFRFFFNDTATPEIYTLSLHDALPI